MKYAVDKTITYQEVDFTGNIKLSNLFSHLTEIATDHAFVLNVWNHDLIETHGWVVAKIHIEIFEPILYEQAITINTWPGKPSKVIFPRFYTITTNDGKYVANISSVWTLLDLKKRRIAMPSRVGIEFPKDIIEEIPTELPRDIDTDNDFEFISKRKVAYSDLDTNLHVNNARYIEWVCDLLDVEDFKDGFITDLTIYFKKEIKMGTTIYFYKKENSKGFTIYGCDEGNTLHYFEVEGFWKRYKK